MWSLAQRLGFPQPPSLFSPLDLYPFSPSPSFDAVVVSHVVAVLSQEGRKERKEGRRERERRFFTVNHCCAAVTNVADPNRAPSRHRVDGSSLALSLPAQNETGNQMPARSAYHQLSIW